MNVGIIGGGLMGRETASALARWVALTDRALPTPKLVAVCDSNPGVLDWYRALPSITQITTDYREVLANAEVEVLYIAVPHHLHEEIYLAALDAGKDMLAEKPFGIDLPTCERIVARVKVSGRFVRCSSEFPFYPIVHRAFQLAGEGLGTLIEGRCVFSHSSDLDPAKPINWKRQAATCGTIGVMGDLGMHVCHLPFRLGIRPQSVYAYLQNLITERPDGSGGTAACDTWDNAWMHTTASMNGSGECFPFTFGTKRIALGEMNTWEFELLGTDGGVRISTKFPKTLWRFQRAGKEQRWMQIDVGAGSVFPTITGEIFEFGFPDAILQMWAAFAAERAGLLGSRFGCATPEEAQSSHRLFAAAERSHAEQAVVKL